MDKELDYTMKFEGISEEKMSVSQAIDSVYESLLEKGYNPINQIIGYLLSGDSSYVTSYKNARSIIKKFERDEILEEVITYYLNRK
ncbi:MAG: IreB family regulatory phosphoprotein [Romboutsia sp.]